MSLSPPRARVGRRINGSFHQANGLGSSRRGCSESPNSGRAAARPGLAPFAGWSDGVKVKSRAAQGNGLSAVPAAGEALAGPESRC